MAAIEMRTITTATAVTTDVTTSKLQEVAEGGRVGRRVKKEDRVNFKTNTCFFHSES